MTTRYPFDLFLIYLLSVFHEQRYIFREVGRYFPHVIEPDGKLPAATRRREKKRRVAALSEHLDKLRSRYPANVLDQERTLEQRGVSELGSDDPAAAEAFKLLEGVERETVELCALSVVLPEDASRIVLSRHKLEVTPEAITLYQKFFFNTGLLYHDDLLSYLDLYPQVTAKIYRDVLLAGRDALCLHLDIDPEDFDPKVNLRAVYRLAYTQLISTKSMDIDSGRVASHWARIMMDAHDRLQEGDDLVKRMLQIMTLFTLGREEQAFAELDAATGEILH